MNKSIIANGILGLGIIGSGVFGYNEYHENKEIHAKNEKLNENLIQDTKKINELNIINKSHEKSIVGYKSQLEKFKINTEKKERKIKKLNASLNESQEELHKLKLEVNRIEALRQAELAKAKVEKVSQEVSSNSNQNDSVKKQVTTTTSKKPTQSSSSSYNQTFQASFYTAHAASTGKSAGDSGYGVTASGTTVQTGRTIACPPSYPFGTKIELEGYGVRVCEDRGGAIQGNRIDIYVSTESEAYSLGRKSIRGRVLN